MGGYTRTQKTDPDAQITDGDVISDQVAVEILENSEDEAISQEAMNMVQALTGGKY